MNEKFFHRTLYSRELESFISEYLAMDLKPFFDQYLRYASLPVLEYRIEGDDLLYRFSADVDDFRMPVKIKSANKGVWLYGTTEWQKTAIERVGSEELVIDPNFLVGLKQLKSEGHR